MILFHGSFCAVSRPDVLHSRLTVDFGRGFYTTSIREQAEKWCERLKRNHQPAVVSRYSFDETALNECKTLRFDSYSEEWLDFVFTCRRGEDSTDFEIVVGGVANDRVFNTLELFTDGLINKTEALNRLRFEEPNQQICFRSQEVLDRFLRFEGSDFL